MNRKRRDSSGIVLAGDIGGTNTRLALVQVVPHFQRIREKIYKSREYPSLDEVLKDFLGERKDFDSACFGAAGPLIDGRVTITNLPWVLDVRRLREALSLEKLELINDLVANAYGIALLKKSDFADLNRGKTKEGHAVLISAGTGLGQGILLWDGKRHWPCPSEGGHVEFAPRNELEIKFLQTLFKRFGRVSYERILSGSGLAAIYAFLRDTGRFRKEPKWLSQKMKDGDPAAVISKSAEMKQNKLCETTLDMFVSIYGAAAGNLALQVMAVGGVYLGGGIAPKIFWRLKEGTFMEAFKDKDRLTGFMSQIPVKVILNDKAALMGAVSRAAELLKEG